MSSSDIYVDTKRGYLINFTDRVEDVNECVWHYTKPEALAKAFFGKLYGSVNGQAFLTDVGRLIKAVK